MAGVIYDGTKLRVYMALQEVCLEAGETKQWRDEFWTELLEDEEVLEEFIYYLEYEDLREKLCCHGFSLIDLFVWQMGLANLRMDTGKNTAACNKESMVLRAFRAMIEMRKDPESFVKKMREDRGMDKME